MQGRDIWRDIERAHLRDPGDGSHEMFRASPAPALRDWIRGYWIPVWTLGRGQHADQRVLGHPVCLTSTRHDSSRFLGPARGMSVTRLTGRGWAVGTILQTAAGSLLLGAAVRGLTDRHLQLDALPVFTGVTDAIRRVMRDDPRDPAARRSAVAMLEERIATLGEADETSLLVNRAVRVIEEDPSLTSVRRLSAIIGLSERSLQRLFSARVGLSPLQLIRRRRLHEAGSLLRRDPRPLAELASELGYSDQAHFSRDWKNTTGMTLREFLRRQHPIPATDR